MQTEAMSGAGYRFSVVDALDAPHDGRILRLRLVSGEAPRLGRLKSRELVATSPTGRICRLSVKDFAVLGGKVRQERFRKERQITVRVREIDQGPVGLKWEVRAATSREMSGGG